MPVFNTTVTTDVDVDVDLEFEIICSCGRGLCDKTDTRLSYGRRMPQAIVEPCQVCIEAAAEDAKTAVRDELQERIDELEDQVNRARDALKAYLREGAQ